MNDLERDLKELFETKASDVQAAPYAPAQVLRRGRRRQVGTVVGGALLAVAAAALVIGGASAFLADRGDAPPMGEGDVLGARTATIAGITVTAPEGWSLLDQWPLGQTIPTEVCTSSGGGTVGPDGSFSDTGTPVGPDGSGNQLPATDPTTEECVRADVPGGAPLFTLANVEPNPLQTVCKVLPELPQQAVGPTDAFLYVGFDANSDAPEWPIDLDEPSAGPCGDTSIARWSVDDVDYLAAAIVGSQVSETDRTALMDAFAELSFGPPDLTASPVVGYVVAAGVQDSLAWRLEAGPSLTCESQGACAVQLALITTDDADGEQAWPIVPPTLGTPLVAASQPLGGTTLVYGAADPSVETLEVTATDGTATAPTSIDWPSTLEAFASPEAPVDGTIWWAMVDEVTSVTATLDDGTTYRTRLGEGGWSTPSGSSTATPPPPTNMPDVASLRLDTRMEGDELVASGVGWELGIGPDPDTGRTATRLVVDGEGTYLSYPRSGGTMTPMQGGALMVYVLSPDEGPLSVTVDGTGETLYGRWMPGPDQFGRESRWWVLPLPGVGSGIDSIGPDDLPKATSWPPGREPAAGVVVSSGSIQNGISWKFAYTSPDCLVLAQVAGDPSIGQTDCLEIPAEGDRLLSFAAGDEQSLVAFVGPEGLITIEGPGPDGKPIYGQCSGSGGLDSGAWEHAGACAIVIPNDVAITLQPAVWDLDLKEEVPIDPFTIRIANGRLFLTDPTG